MIYQLKSFTGRMTPNRRRQVKDSLQRAGQHEPVRWFLVVPIDHTPGELEWFEDLVEECEFECRWLGRTWLDREMAERPAIVRYYAHGERYTFEEFCDLLASIGSGPPLGQEGVISAVVDRVRVMVRKVNDADPHYDFGLDLRPDGNVRVSVRPKYLGAERDRPLVRVRFDFPDTPEGEQARRALEESVSYGTRAVMGPEFISELSLDVLTGLGSDLENYEVVLGSPAPHLVGEVKMVLRAIDDQGTALAQLPLEADQASIGARGIRIMLRDKSGWLTATATFNISDLSLKLDWNFSIPQEYSPHDILPAAKFVSALERGARVEVLFKGDTIGPEQPGPMRPANTGEATQSAGFLEHLANVQIKTGIFFDVTEGLTPEETDDIETASRLLNGEELTRTWDEVTIDITPDGRDAFRTALQGRSTHNLQLGSDLNINIQGVTIPIGRVVQAMESARVLEWETSADAAANETTKVTLVPAETNTLTMALETQ